MRDYLVCNTSYTAGLADYKLTSQNSSTSTIKSAVKETYDTAQHVSNALKSVNTFLQFYSDQMKNQTQISYGELVCESPLKMKDELIANAFVFLRKHKLLDEHDDEERGDIGFGQR